MGPADSRKKLMKSLGEALVWTRHTDSAKTIELLATSLSAFWVENGFPTSLFEEATLCVWHWGSLMLLWKEHIYIYILFDNPGRYRSKIMPNYDEELTLRKWDSWGTPVVVVLRPQPPSLLTLLSPPYTMLSSHERSLQWTTHLTSFLLSYTWRHFPGCIFKAPLTKIANKSLRFKFL